MQGCSGVSGSDDTRFMGLGPDVGRELPRDEPVVFVLFLDERSQVHSWKRSQHACLFRGYN